MGVRSKNGSVPALSLCNCWSTIRRCNQSCSWHLQRSHKWLQLLVLTLMSYSYPLRSEFLLSPESLLDCQLFVTWLFVQIHYLIRGPKWINSFYSHCLWRNANKIVSLRVFSLLLNIFSSAFLSRKLSFWRSRKANLIKATLLRDLIPTSALKTKLPSF